MENQYKPLIRKIRRRKTGVIIFILVMIFLLFAIASPTDIQILDFEYHDEGLPTGVTVLFGILIFLLEYVLLAIVSAPINAALFTECDPEKYLALRSAWNTNKKQMETVYLNAFFYMGNFDAALPYAEMQIARKHTIQVLSGLASRARLEFFTQNFDAMRKTIAQYHKIFATQNIPERHRKAHLPMGILLSLYLAIANGDEEKIREYAKAATPWNTTKINEGYISYLKGYAAYLTGDTEEAIFRLNAVKATMGKTFLSRSAEVYLDELRKKIEA